MDLEYVIPPERLRTERLLIRSYRPGDGAQLAAATNASFQHLRAFMPWLMPNRSAVSYTHLRAHETVLELVCRLLLEKKRTGGINCDASRAP